MKLVFANNQVFDLGLYSSALADVYKKIYKHLCHVELRFRPWDNPYYLDSLTHEQVVDQLTFYGSQVCVTVDRSRCMARDQQYLNQLHKIYEDNYQGQPQWLDYHEHVHLCEPRVGLKFKVLEIDFREKAGLLERQFDPAWLEHSTTQVKAGDVYVTWAELGKTPYRYWKDQEPEDIKRMCVLAKPWLKLRPKIKIAMQDIDLLDNPDIEAFESWWKTYEREWCNHWHLSSWSVQDIFAHSVFGHIENLRTIKSLLQSGVSPVGISIT